MSQLSFDVIKRVWPKSGLVTLFKKYSSIIYHDPMESMDKSQRPMPVNAKYGFVSIAKYGLVDFGSRSQSRLPNF